MLSRRLIPYEDHDGDIEEPLTEMEDNSESENLGKIYRMKSIHSYS